MTDESADSGAAAGPYLLHDSSLDPSGVQEQQPELNLQARPWSERESIPAEARVYLCLGDEQVRELAPLALARQWEVALLPHDEAHHAMAALGVKGNPEALLEHYEQAPVIEADALYCNEELVFSSVVIGRVLGLRPYDINRRQTRWSVLSGALRGLTRMRLTAYSITTGKERKVRLAALGMVALDNTQSSLVGRNFEENLSITDGQLSLLALAPRSILGYLRFILTLLLPGKMTLARLPPSLALLQSHYLCVECPSGMEYLLDGKPVHAREKLEFKMQEARLRLVPGPALVAREELRSTGKESVRLNEVPLDEGAKELDGKHLPLFSHASESEYRELFVSLRDNATASTPFKVLMVLSVLLAMTGLYANSAPVIIGAMILAPLMAPIVSLAMGLARTDTGLISASLRTLGVGIAWGLGCAVVFSWAMPLELPTPEMRARMSPTLLDLLVAVISGAAGAYANAKEEIARSLAGVAIAVALVPPLGVLGIGLGWGDWQMAGGAGLLFITNLVGIALAGSITFLVLGFAPFHRARKGVGITALFMLLISAPLVVAFQQLVGRDQVLEQVPRGWVVIGGESVHVSDVVVGGGEVPVIRLVMSAAEPLGTSHVDELKAQIEDRLGRSVTLEARIHLWR